MAKFHLAIAEHQEFGGNGIIIVKSQSRNSRNYFEPALAGFTLAHDILEHTVTPHCDGYVDELMALGGLIAGRIECGWESPYGRRITLKDISSDIYSLASASLMEYNSFNVEKCNSYIQDKDLMAEIKTAIRQGLIEAINEYEDEVYTNIPENYNYDINSMAGHIAKGYQLFRKRFGHIRYNFIYLFDEISREADKFMKNAEVGQEAILKVDFKNCRVNLDEFYGDDDDDNY